MKRNFLLAVLALVMALPLGAQNLLRHNYKKNNLIYTAAERQRIEAPSSKDYALQVKLSRVLFTDGQPVYILRIDVEDAVAWKMPVNAPLTITTSDGKQVLLKNSADAPNMVAPQGVKNPSGKTVFLNYGEYYLEQPDMDKLLSGIVSVDLTKRWSSDGRIKVTYKNNELGSALSRQYKAITSAPKPSRELGSNLHSLQDQRGSRLVETNSVKVGDGISASMVYLYYAASNSESIDLNLQLDGYTVPFTNSVKIVTRSGETIVLKQEKDMPAGRVICYPTLEQVRQMSRGVARLVVQTTGGEKTFTFPSDELGKAVDMLYNSLMTVSVL